MKWAGGKQTYSHPLTPTRRAAPAYMINAAGQSPVGQTPRKEDVEGIPRRYKSYDRMNLG